MKPSLASRVVAVILLSVLLACLLHLSDQATLTRASTMTDAEIAQYYRDVHSHSVAFHGFSILIAGMIFMFCVEFISHLIRGFWRKIDPETMASA